MTIFYNFRRKCEAEIEPTISLPANFITVTPESLRAAYIITYEGLPPVIQYITKSKGIEAAKYLFRKGIISGYKKADDGSITLFHECYLQGVRQEDIILPWEEKSIKPLITATDVKRWALLKEYRRCRRGMPLCGAKLKKKDSVVIQMSPLAPSLNIA